MAGVLTRRHRTLKLRAEEKMENVVQRMEDFQIVRKIKFNYADKKLSKPIDIVDVVYE